jgi:hypothetical protein
MKVIAVIEDEEVIYRILAHLHLLAPGDGPGAPPKSTGLRELIYEPVFDLPVRGRTQAGDLPWMDPASVSPAGGLRRELTRAARKGEVCPETPRTEPDRPLACVFALTSSPLADSVPRREQDLGTAALEDAPSRCPGPRSRWLCSPPRSGPFPTSYLMIHLLAMLVIVLIIFGPGKLTELGGSTGVHLTGRKRRR